MTKLLDQALQAARELPDDTQDDIARVVLQLAGLDQHGPYGLSAGEKRAVDESIAAAKRGEFASDEDVAAVWAKHGL